MMCITHAITGMYSNDCQTMKTLKQANESKMKPKIIPRIGKGWLSQAEHTVVQAKWPIRPEFIAVPKAWSN